MYILHIFFNIEIDLLGVLRINPYCKKKKKAYMIIQYLSLPRANTKKGTHIHSSHSKFTTHNIVLY